MGQTSGRPAKAVCVGGGALIKPAQDPAKAVHLGRPKVLCVVHFVFVGKVGDDEGILPGQFIHTDPEFEVGVFAFFFGFQPPELGEFVGLFGHHSRRFFAAIPEEDVDVLLDVHVVAEPLGQARGGADAVEQDAFGAVQGDLHLELHFFNGHHGGFVLNGSNWYANTRNPERFTRYDIPNGNLRLALHE